MAPGSSLPLALAALKPAKKPRGKADKRLYPAYVPGVTSTADYINAYYGLNSGGKIAAWPRYCTDWLSLYHPLPDTPAALYQGVDSVETVE